MKDSREKEEFIKNEGGERRRNLRISINMLVTYWVDIQDRTESYEVKSLNLGEEGIFVTIETPLALGTEVLLRFILPGSPVPMNVKGEVVWIRNHHETAGEPAGKGIRFKDLNTQNKKLLNEYITKTRNRFLEERSSKKTSP